MKSRHQRFDVIAEMRPLRMPRNLRLLPGRETGVKIGKRLFGLALEPRQFLANGNGIALRGELTQFSKTLASSSATGFSKSR